jgi:hypothetical protein
MKRIQSRAIAIAIFFVTAIFVQEPSAVHFGVIPYMSKNMSGIAKDKHNDFYISFEAAVDSVIAQRQPDWRAVDSTVEERLYKAFRLHLQQSDAQIDSLPYAAWDLCFEQKIKYLLIFYLFDSQDAEADMLLRSNFERYSGLTVAGALKEELSDWEVNYYLSVYDVQSNKAIFHYVEDIDDLLETTSHDTERRVARPCDSNES